MKSKFLKILGALIVIWLVALVGFGIKLYLDLQVPEADLAAIKKLENSLVEFHKKNGKYPSSSDLSPYDADLESDAHLMKWLPAEKEKAVAPLVDSAGNLYRIRLDSNGDGKIFSPLDKQLVNKSVLIWSAGKDSKFETWRDNGRSWE